MQGEWSQRHVYAGRLKWILDLAEDDIAVGAFGGVAQVKAAAIDGSTDNCVPVVRADQLEFGQLPCTVPVVVPFWVVTSNCDTRTWTALAS